MHAFPIHVFGQGNAFLDKSDTQPFGSAGQGGLSHPHWSVPVSIGLDDCTQGVRQALAVAPDGAEVDVRAGPHFAEVSWFEHRIGALGRTAGGKTGREGVDHVAGHDVVGAEAPCCRTRREHVGQRAEAGGLEGL